MSERKIIENNCKRYQTFITSERKPKKYSNLTTNNSDSIPITHSNSSDNSIPITSSNNSGGSDIPVTNSNSSSSAFLSPAIIKLGLKDELT